MINRFIIIAALLFTVVVAAQEGTSSPYSYYGIGLNKFKGTVENQSMGGIMVFSDSIHVNLRNPASYGKLRLTTYSVGGSHTWTDLSTSQAEGKTTNASLDYLAIGIPTGKLNFGVGVIPYTSVGYRFEDVTETTANQFSGRGGMNKVYLTTAYAITPGLSVGVDVNYNFGNIQNTHTIFQSEIQYGTREINRSDLMGFNVNLGVDYQTSLGNGLRLHTAATYAPQMDINVDRIRNLATVTFGSEGRTVVTDQRNLPDVSEKLSLPAQLSLGAGLGRVNKWFIGGEFTGIQATEYNLNAGPTSLAHSYEDAAQFRLGGYYVPQYNSPSYFNRIVYRAGLRYEETGLTLNNEGIDEFGISFGIGLPAGINFSNTNIGIEYGQRGTTDSGLIKENFFKLSLSLSLNDKWFERRLFD